MLRLALPLLVALVLTLPALHAAPMEDGVVAQDRYHTAGWVAVLVRTDGTPFNLSSRAEFAESSHRHFGGVLYDQNQTAIHGVLGWIVPPTPFLYAHAEGPSGVEIHHETPQRQDSSVASMNFYWMRPPPPGDYTLLQWWGNNVSNWNWTLRASGGVELLNMTHGTSVLMHRDTDFQGDVVIQSGTGPFTTVHHNSSAPLLINHTFIGSFRGFPTNFPRLETPSGDARCPCAWWEPGELPAGDYTARLDGVAFAPATLFGADVEFPR